TIPISTLFPYTTLFRSEEVQTSVKFVKLPSPHPQPLSQWERVAEGRGEGSVGDRTALLGGLRLLATTSYRNLMNSTTMIQTEERSEEHTSELQSLAYLV